MYTYVYPNEVIGGGVRPQPGCVYRPVVGPVPFAARGMDFELVDVGEDEVRAGGGERSQLEMLMLHFRLERLEVAEELLPACAS